MLKNGYLQVTCDLNNIELDAKGILTILNDNKFCRICGTNAEKVKKNYMRYGTIKIEQMSFKKLLYISCPEMDLYAISKVILCRDCLQMCNIIINLINKYSNCKEQICKNYENKTNIIEDLNVSIKQDIKVEATDLFDVENTKALKICKCIDNINSNKLNYNSKQSSDYSPHKYLECDYNNLKRNKLKLHMGNHSAKKGFNCSQCNFSTTRKYALDRHIYTHTGEKPFKCSQCNYSSVQKSDMMLHMHIHTGERPFKCPHCNYTSARKSNLVKHRYTHTSEKRFKCLRCNYSCITKSDLIAHIYSHKHSLTRENPFKCSLCNYSTARKSNLIKHMPRHTGENLLKCMHCSYHTARKFDLTRHIHRLHLERNSVNIDNVIT